MARIEGLAYAAGSLETEFMESAGIHVAEAVETFIAEHKIARKVILLVGKGNNAGDAYVAGIHLLAKGFQVEACHIYSLDLCGPLCREQCQRFVQAGGTLHCVHRPGEIHLPKEGVILDGLVGTGFRGKAENELAAAIETANASGLPILAIDIPSGLCGNTGSVETVAISAVCTLYLELPKIGFFLGKGWDCVGKLMRVSFGLPKAFIEQAKPEVFLHTDMPLRASLPPISRTRHKYQTGYLLVLAGSDTMPGAGRLVSYSALRSGAGIVRWFYPWGMELAAQVPDILYEPWNLRDWSRIKQESCKAKAYVVGPGLGRSKQTTKMLKKFFSFCNLPCVIDADALHVLSLCSTDLPKQSLLTPHQGEMKALLGEMPSSFLRQVQEYADNKQASILLKGAPNFFFQPGQIPWILPFGNPGMAKAGSGDVLSGILGALLAQGLPIEKAAVLGCYLHGLAGDLAAQQKTAYGMIASDMIENIPQAIHKVFS